jgi:hypothetical protein
MRLWLKSNDDASPADVIILLYFKFKIFKCKAQVILFDAATFWHRGAFRPRDCDNRAGNFPLQMHQNPDRK